MTGILLLAFFFGLTEMLGCSYGKTLCLLIETSIVSSLLECSPSSVSSILISEYCGGGLLKLLAFGLIILWIGAAELFLSRFGISNKSLEPDPTYFPAGKLSLFSRFSVAIGLALTSLPKCTLLRRSGLGLLPLLISNLSLLPCFFIIYFYDYKIR